MDLGRGFMEEITEELRAEADTRWSKGFGKKSGVFHVGEVLEIKGAWFRVKKINPFGIMLKSIRSKTNNLNKTNRQTKLS